MKKKLLPYYGHMVVFWVSIVAVLEVWKRGDGPGPITTTLLLSGLAGYALMAALRDDRP